MWFITLVAALAAPLNPSPPSETASSTEWTLSNRAWRIDAPVAFAQRTGALDLQSGYIFRVEDASGPVGAILVGEGTWTVHFEDPRQARRFANRRVLAAGDDPASLIDVAWGDPWSTRVDRGGLYGVDVWSTLEPSLMEVMTRGSALVTGDDPRVEELLVVKDISLRAARLVAEELLVHRTRFARDHASDPAAWVAMDRIEGCRRAADGSEACNRYADLRTASTWDRYTGVNFLGAGNRWLHWVRDPRGLLDLRTEEQVLSVAVDSWGETSWREVATAAFPPDPFGVPTPPHRVDLHEARVRHEVGVEGRVMLAQDTVAELTVRAVGGDARVVVVDVPHIEQPLFMEMPQLPNGWALLGVELLDGTPLRYTRVGLRGDHRDGRGAVRTLLVELPEALGPDALATLRVRYRDHHRYAHFLESSDAWGNQSESAGVGADFQALPTIRGHGGFPYQAVITVGLPTNHPRHTVAISGSQRREWQDERSWTEAVTRHGEVARVAVGRFTVREEPGGAVAPTVTAALQPGHGQSAPEVAALVRQAFAFNESLLHPIDAQRFTVAELGSTGALSTQADWGEGLVTVRPALNETRGRALLLPSAFSMIAGVHRQWWLGTGAYGIDATLPDQMSGAYALAFVNRTSRRVDFEELRDVARELVQQGNFSAISRARAAPWRAPRQIFSPQPSNTPGLGLRTPTPDRDRIVDRGDLPFLGAFVLGLTLRDEVGDEAFFQAVHHVVLGNAAPTWDGLQFALEEASGRDLSDWFDVWVHGDHAPSVALTWAQRDDELQIALTTDVPFGGFTVPVRINGTVHRVELIDGAGTLSVPLARASKRPQIKIDPDGTLLLASKRVTQAR